MGNRRTEFSLKETSRPVQYLCERPVRKNCEINIRFGHKGITDMFFR